MNIILAYFAKKYKGDWDAIYKALESKEKVSHDDITALEKELEQLKVKGVHMVTIVDRNYPEKLKQAYKPPFVIFYKGDLELLDKKTMCLTGDHAADDKVVDYVAQSVEAIEKNHVVVNRLETHLEANINKQFTKPQIHVVASGLEHFVKTNSVKEGSLMITEYPEEVKASAATKRNINRIVGALSSAGIVIYSSEKNSKINHLVNEFLNLGSSVYCYPGTGNEKEGNFDFVKQGARLITKIVDVQ